MPRLSLVMIVKNEASRLEECLSSVAGVTDEMVIGDTGSTDGTPEIAGSFGARVLTVPWRDDFAEARNTVLAAATGDWLLHLDADEILDPDAATLIRALVDADGHGDDAVELVLANYCNDPRAWRWMPVHPDNPWARGWSGYLRVPLLRLFRNGRGYAYREPVHENITESVQELGGRIRTENDILVHHYGYDTDARRQGDKAALYLSIARRKAAERPQDVKALHDYAEQALACNLTDESEQACRQALALNPLDMESATTLANILLNRGDLVEGRQLLEHLEAAGIAPPHLVTALGAIACHDGRLYEALNRFNAVLELVPGSVMALLYRARVHDRLDQPAKALEDLRAAHALTPGIEEVHHRIGALEHRQTAAQYMAVGRTAQALRELLEAMRLDPEDPIIHCLLGDLMLMLNDSQRARAGFERALRIAPGMPAAKQGLLRIRK